MTTNHHEIETVLSEFCQANKTEYEFKSKSLGAIVIYTYELYEEIDSFTIKYSYEFDIPQGGRWPFFKISLASSRSHYAVNITRRNFISKVVFGEYFKVSSDQMLDKRRLVKHLNPLKRVSHPNFHFSGNTGILKFNSFPESSEYLMELRNSILTLLRETLKPSIK